ncbi:MAG: M28 family peptidase [Chthonomonadales bacterium]
MKFHNPLNRFLLPAILIIGLSTSGRADVPVPKITPPLQVMLDHVSSNSLKGHLSFIASDALEGRGTPSRGLDLAAEYIAAQFRRAGLEPAGDDGYFQTAPAPAVRGAEPAPDAKPVKVRNVIGILRGTDPVLKDTYVLVTAHYDHLGKRVINMVDTIFNGANDDGSGTVSVMEIAGALASMKEKPKRSIVFMTFFGEERGLLGSRYYGKNPVFPIAKTIADLNLEQIGRTDDFEGPQVAAASMTGFDFTDLGPIFQAAGKAVGIVVSKRSPMSDNYFGRSDNQALADQGVPAHTLCVAYEYPDYHQATDHWEKVDYDNMARVDRMVALGLWMLANSASEPKWNTENPKTMRYVDAWKTHHPK